MVDHDQSCLESFDIRCTQISGRYAQGDWGLHLHSALLTGANNSLYEATVVADICTVLYMARSFCSAYLQHLFLNTSHARQHAVHAGSMSNTLRHAPPYLSCAIWLGKTTL